jgi:hypothetical protein
MASAREDQAHVARAAQRFQDIGRRASTAGDAVVSCDEAISPVGASGRQIMSAKRINWACWSLSLSLTAVGFAAAGTEGLRGGVNTGVNVPPAVRDWPCPSGAQYGQPSKDSSAPDWAAFTSAQTSEFTYKVYDTFSGVGGGIGQIDWWGLSLLYNAGWSACDPTGVQFEITFYAPGSTPGAVVCGPYEVSPSFTIVDNVLGFNLYYFETQALIPDCWQSPEGWVSIQSLPNAGGCAFLWFDSYTGVLAALQDQLGVLVPLGDNMAFCLTPDYPCCYGACCDDSSGTCEDNVEMLYCFGTGRRYELNVTCADMTPPCGEATGACCYDDGGCAQTTPSMCATLIGDANCDGRIDFDDIDPFVALLSGGTIPGCPRGDGDCNRDGVIDFNDIDPFIEILSSGGALLIHGTYLGAGAPCDSCPCIVPCPPGATTENEPCYTDTNGGCNSSPFIFGNISCGDTICGTSYFDGYTRDTEWWIVQGLTGANVFTVTAQAKFDLQLLFITDTGNDCVGYTYLVATAPACATATIATGGLPMDTYYVWVGPQFTSTFACTDGDPQYWVHLDCTPVPSGACCSICICYDAYTMDACNAIGGTYMGDGTLCQNMFCCWPPDGENCADPRIIPGVPYNDADNTCIYVLDCPASCGENNAPDLVYQWTPTEDGVATASLCGSSYDTVIHVQTPCCGDDIVCNDDYVPCGLQSQVSWNATAGVDYYIIVSGFYTNCGAYTLSLTTPPPMGACCYADDSCALTTPASCDGAWLGVNTTCDPNPCPPTGACCYADDSCGVTTPANCTGTWLGVNTICDPNPCPPPPGAVLLRECDRGLGRAGPCAAKTNGSTSSPSWGATFTVCA